MSVIDEYLAELDDELRVRLRRRERILAEVRGHLEQRASEAQEEKRVSQAEAERRAVAACGPPAQVAKGFAAEPGGALNTTAVAISDFSYRAARNGAELTAAALMTLVVVALGIWGVDADSPLYQGLLYLWSLWGLVVGTALQKVVKPAPREGYVRRLRKLDRAGRQQIAGVLRGGKAPLQPRASHVAAEVRQRVRNLRRYALVLFPLPFALGALLTLGFVVARGDLDEAVRPGLWLAASLTALIAASRWDLRSARRQVEAELAALEVVEEVAGEALRSGTARLQERFAPRAPRRDRFWFELSPENPNACPVSLEVGKHALTLWLGPKQLRHRIRRRDPDHRRELGLYLDAIVSGGYHEEARLIEAARWRFSPRTRLYTQFVDVFDTKDGPRRVTGRRFYSKDWEEFWQAVRSESNFDHPGCLVEQRFAPYKGAT